MNNVERAPEREKAPLLSIIVPVYKVENFNISTPSLPRILMFIDKYLYPPHFLLTDSYT